MTLRERWDRQRARDAAYRTLAAAVPLPLVGVFFWSMGVAPAELNSTSRWIWCWAPTWR